VTVIRPTCVYGPFGRTFTITPLEFLRLGIPLVASDNPGRANLIYIDNLVDLILSAVDRRPSASRVYLATEEEPADWETLYSAYARTIGVPLQRFSSSGSRAQMLREEITVSMSNARRLARPVARDVKGSLLRGLATYHRHVPLLQRCDGLVPMGALRKAVGAARSSAGSSGARSATASPGTPQNGVRPFAPRELREFYGAKATFTAERARRELGWTPRITAAEAIDRTCDWITFAGI
jgi:nucleoside-diphosphate-sugar epimerase